MITCLNDRINKGINLKEFNSDGLILIVQDGDRSIRVLNSHNYPWFHREGTLRNMNHGHEIKFVLW